MHDAASCAGSRVERPESVKLARTIEASNLHSFLAQPATWHLKSASNRTEKARTAAEAAAISPVVTSNQTLPTQTHIEERTEQLENSMQTLLTPMTEKEPLPDKVKREAVALKAFMDARTKDRESKTIERQARRQ